MDDLYDRRAAGGGRGTSTARTNSLAGALAEARRRAGTSEESGSRKLLPSVAGHQRFAMGTSVAPADYRANA